MKTIETAVNEAIETAVTSLTGDSSIRGEGFSLRFIPAEGIIVLNTSNEMMKEEVKIGPEEFWERVGWATWEDEPQSTRDFVTEYYGVCWIDRLGIADVEAAAVEEDFCDECNMIGGYCGMCDGSHWNPKKRERPCQCGSGEEWHGCPANDAHCG